GRQSVPLRVVLPDPRGNQARGRDRIGCHAGARRLAMKTASGSPVMDRRHFIRVGALAGGGLLIGTYVGLGDLDAGESPAVAAGEFTPNAFIRISSSGAISIVAPNSEMGQGVKTSLPMIVAEELDVPWEQVTITQGDLNPAYGRQMSVGSQSTPSNFAPLRSAGATARAVLVQPAADTSALPPPDS